jgi:predicted esterase
MSETFAKESIKLDVCDRAWPAMVMAPHEVCDDPWLVVNLANDCFSALRHTTFGGLVRPMLRAGHYAASFTLPYHRELADKAMGHELQAFVTAMQQGIDVFGQIRQVGKTLIDHVTETMMLVEPRHIVIAGTSRGGISALHVMSVDDRVQAAALVCPVTDLSKLSEFEQLDGNPLADDSHAMSLLGKVSDRPIWITINQSDERVDEKACLAFADALSEKKDHHPKPVIWPETGHAVPLEAYELGGAFLRDWITLQDV